MKKILILLTFVSIFLIFPLATFAYGECSKYGYMAVYDSYTNTCKCMSGYVFDDDYFGGSQCVLCSTKYGYGATYDYIGGGCKCMSGYVWGKDILGGDYCISKDQWCQDEYGYGSTSDYLSDGCKCRYGYVFGKDSFGDTQCVLGSLACSKQYGVMATYNSLSDKCECYAGYIFSTDSIGGIQCISEDSWCQDKYGYNSKYNSLSDKCECRSGYELTLKGGSGLECVSCFSKYGLHSSYDYLDNKCECDNGYTLNDNNQCVEKQNNVYFLLEKLDLDNNKAIVKGDYDYREYLIEYGYGCYDSTIKRYLNKKIVINLGTDFDLDRWDKIVLQDDSTSCDITDVERIFGTSDICEEGYVQKDDRCVSYEETIICSNNSTKIGSQCVCNNGYIASGNSCITYTDNCHNQFGVNSYGDGTYCYCNVGYEWNSSKTSCIKKTISEQTTDIKITKQPDNSKEEKIVVDEKTPKEEENKLQGRDEEKETFFETTDNTKKLGFLASVSNGVKNFVKSIGNFFGRIFK